ncbi:MAG: histidine phosphatase family protein [Oscillospiraceae bacterium]|nr:histidine phosphatase family protein [Oscillospiraceae bacterium]
MILTIGGAYQGKLDFTKETFGIFEMHSYEQRKDDPRYQAWITGDNNANIPPEGECGQQMTNRVLVGFSKIRENACIITHGRVIAAIMEHLFPNEGKNHYQWQPENGAGWIVDEKGYRTLK